MPCLYVMAPPSPRWTVSTSSCARQTVATTKRLDVPATECCMLIDMYERGMLAGNGGAPTEAAGHSVTGAEAGDVLGNHMGVRFDAWTQCHLLCCVGREISDGTCRRPCAITDELARTVKPQTSAVVFLPHSHICLHSGKPVNCMPTVTRLVRSCNQCCHTVAMREQGS